MRLNDVNHLNLKKYLKKVLDSIDTIKWGGEWGVRLFFKLFPIVVDSVAKKSFNITPPHPTQPHPYSFLTPTYYTPNPTPLKEILYYILEENPPISL